MCGRRGEEGAGVRVAPEQGWVARRGDVGAILNGLTLCEIVCEMQRYKIQEIQTSIPSKNTNKNKYKPSKKGTWDSPCVKYKDTKFKNTNKYAQPGSHLSGLSLCEIQKCKTKNQKKHKQMRVAQRGDTVAI